MITLPFFVADSGHPGRAAIFSLAALFLLPCLAARNSELRELWLCEALGNSNASALGYTDIERLSMGELTESTSSLKRQ
jgi:hypothetical protein